LSDDGSAIVAHEVCLNRKFVADFRRSNAFFCGKKCKTLFRLQEVSDPQDRFGVGLIVRLMDEVGISYVEKFSAGLNRLGTTVENVFSETRFPGGECLSY
jgi:hypothetical protein